MRELRPVVSPQLAKSRKTNTGNTLIRPNVLQRLKVCAMSEIQTEKSWAGGGGKGAAPFT